MWWSFDTSSCIYQPTDGLSGNKVSLVMVVLLGVWEALIALRLMCKHTSFPLTHSAYASVQRNTRQAECIVVASTENQATCHYHKILILIVNNLHSLQCRHKEIDASVNDAIEIAGHCDSDMRSGIHTVLPSDIKNTFRQHYHQQAHQVWHLPLTTFDQR